MLLATRMHQELGEPQTAGLSASKTSAAVGSTISSMSPVATWMVKGISTYSKRRNTIQLHDFDHRPLLYFNKCFSTCFMKLLL